MGSKLYGAMDGTLKSRNMSRRVGSTTAYRVKTRSKRLATPLPAAGTPKTGEARHKMRASLSPIRHCSIRELQPEWSVSIKSAFANNVVTVAGLQETW